jgi:hypothetical protein
MQVRYCFVHLVVKNITVKTKFKMYYKYKHMQVMISLLDSFHA